MKQAGSATFDPLEMRAVISHSSQRGNRHLSLSVIYGLSTIDTRFLVVVETSSVLSRGDGDYLVQATPQITLRIL